MIINGQEYKHITPEIFWEYVAASLEEKIGEETRLDRLGWKLKRTKDVSEHSLVQPPALKKHRSTVLNIIPFGEVRLNTNPTAYGETPENRIIDPNGVIYYISGVDFNFPGLYAETLFKYSNKKIKRRGKDKVVKSEIYAAHDFSVERKIPQEAVVARDLGIPVQSYYRRMCHEKVAYNKDYLVSPNMNMDLWELHKAEQKLVFKQWFSIIIQTLDLACSLWNGTLSNSEKKIAYIHRDFKPENILVDIDLEEYDPEEDPVVTLWDFEMACKVSENSRFLDERVGTDGYFAPELADGLSVYNTRTDIYSLGLVLNKTLDLARETVDTNAQTLWDNFYDLLSRMCNENPDERPLPQEIKEKTNAFQVFAKENHLLPKKPRKKDYHNRNEKNRTEPNPTQKGDDTYIAAFEQHYNEENFGFEEYKRANKKYQKQNCCSLFYKHGQVGIKRAWGLVNAFKGKPDTEKRRDAIVKFFQKRRFSAAAKNNDLSFIRYFLPVFKDKMRELQDLFNLPEGTNYQKIEPPTVIPSFSKNDNKTDDKELCKQWLKAFQKLAEAVNVNKLCRQNTQLS